MVEILDSLCGAMVEKKNDRAYQHSKDRQSNGLDVNDFSNQLSQLSISRNPFRDVSSSSYLLLLTPYLHSPPVSLISSPGTDPFERFGRRLIRYHSNIRHVPYVAGHGMVDIHRVSIEHAGGVIVAICDSSSSTVHGNERLDLETDQIAFAEEVSGFIEEAGVPALLVSVGLSLTSRLHFAGDYLAIGDWAGVETAAEMVYQL
jgi:hypothetical protein